MEWNDVVWRRGTSERFVIKSERRATRNTTGERREKKGKSPQSPFSFIVRAKQVQAPFDLRLKYSYIFQRVFAHAKSEAFFNLQRTSTLYIWNINLSSSQVEISDSVDRAHYSEASFFRPLLSPPLDREMALFSIPFSLESRFLFPSSPIKVNGRPPRFVCSLSLPLSDQLIALPNDRGFCSQT